MIIMTKFILLILTLNLLSPVVPAQKSKNNNFSDIDKKVLLLPDSLATTTSGIASYISSNFHTEKEKARAVFIWIASNIEYDIDNVFAINFYESKLEKITKPLRSRKGICENYAVLFSDICTKLNIKSFVIEGYTKQNGFTSYLPHMWCAAFVDSAWFMFDPTWGAGYIGNGKFHKRINDNYFKALPSSLIKSHMPFDYLWQFLSYPVTNHEFYENRTEENKSKKSFHYPDSIKAHEKLSFIEQLKTSSERIERNGVKNALIYNKLYYIKLEIEYNRQSEVANIYNAAASDYNEAINLHNKYIHYWNDRFIPIKTDIEIQNMIDMAGNKLITAQKKLGEIKNSDFHMESMILQLNKSISDAVLHIQDEQEWLKIYFPKSIINRKSMFYGRKVNNTGVTNK